MTTLPTQNSDLLAVYITPLSRNAGFHASRYLGKRISSRLHYLPVAQRRVEINVFEYISFDNVKIFSVNKNV
jgi:hypothetical protein